MAPYEDKVPFKVKYRKYIYAAVLAWIVTMFVRPVISDGNAMFPTIGDGEVIIVAKQNYTPVRGAPEFGQIVAFRKDFIAAEEKGENTIRRVIGLPGDKIEIKDGKVYRNDRLLEEGYAKGVTEGDVPASIIKEDEVFVLGDNREESIDSRDPKVGPLKMNLIRGYCAFVVWPLGDLGTVK